MIDQMRGSFGHAPRIARGTHATTFAGVGDQKIVLALVAVGAGEAVGEDAAFEIAAEGSLDMGRRCFTVLAAGEFQPGFEVGLDDAIPQRPLGTAALVALGCGRGALSGGCHRGGPSWSGDRDRILYISSALWRRSTAAVCRQNRVVSHSSGFLAPEPRVIPMAAAPPEAALRFRTLDQSAILKTLTGVGNANGRFQSGAVRWLSKV